MDNRKFLFLLSGLFVHFCFVDSYAMIVRNLSTDQRSLLEFKARIFDPHNILANNWTDSNDVCNWIGVSCAAKHRRVRGLNLPSMNLTGTIPPHLGNLSFLVSLNLSGNNFHGYLPNELGQLNRLKLIDLSFNFLSGEIPSWFGSLRNDNSSGLGAMSNLEILNLGNNQLSDSLPLAIYTISSLQIISLKNNTLSGSLPEDICHNLPNLEVLNLHKNEFSGQIPSVIDKCSNLQSLDLSYNKFSGIIPRSIGNVTRLQLLDLGGNSLEGEIPWEIGNLRALEIFVVEEMKLIVGPIPASVLNASSLRMISLYNNNLFGTIPEDMCEKLHHLEYLSLDYNSFSGHIPTNIGGCSNLQVLTLSYNQFVGLIPTSIGNLTKLEETYLDENVLKGEIPSEIGDCRNLQYLSLTANLLSGPIPRHIGNLTKLKMIQIGANDIEGEIPWEIGNLIALEFIWAESLHLSGLIPSSIFNISSLTEIYLGNNTLSGKLPYMRSVPNLFTLNLWGNSLSGNIPDYIGNATKLLYLHLENNSFSGVIPNTFDNLRVLEEFGISSNNLTAGTSNGEWSFLRSLTNCRHLILLDVSSNPLDGVLPTSISNLSTSLQQFIAGDCKINGSIPVEISSLSNVIILDFSNNELTGAIPATIGRLKNLQGLSLYNNKLQGSLPYDVCGLKGLNTLSLAANELDGPIPTCFGDLLSLRHLNLSFNKFHLTIPSTFWSFKDVLKVDLSSNKLSGSLPLVIGNLKVLTYLDLSRNLLSSDIPSTIGSLVNLQVLSLSSNALQGPIPSSLGGMMSLTMLDLSNNNLTGAIPRSLERLSDLKYFNVSFNRLEGEIPSEGPFMNFSARSFLRNFALCGSRRFQVPPCKSSSHQQSKKTAMRALKYVLPIIASVITIIAFIILYKKRKSRSTKLATDEDLIPLEKLRRVSYNQLFRGTHGFSEDNLLGSGSFGSVYKGVLLDGTIVAVKVFNLQTEGAFKSFDIECQVMRNIRHRNLVEVITSCSNIDFKALVIEFMPNGSLERWLYSYNYSLDMLQRINIMIDVASALEYLHLEHPTVIHCDLKPSNVLLDKDMVAHVGDFGMAKLLGEEESIRQTMTLATIGYMAPEYGLTGIISMKSDVYSYGILLMEVFTRKKPTDEIFAGEMSLKLWVKGSLSKGPIDVADSNLVHEEDEYFVVKANCISSIFELAINCSADLPEDRPYMKDVVAKLKNIKRKLLSNIKQDIQK